MPRIYVACLASYNNGVLHGEWLDLDDIDEVRDGIAKMLRESPHPNVEVDCPDCADAAGDEHDGVVVAPGQVWRSNYWPDGKGQCMPCETCNGGGTVPSAEEWAIHDYDDVPGSWGEHPDLEKLVEFARLYEEHGEAFVAWADMDGASYHEAVDFEEKFREAYQGTFDTEAAWAEQFLEDTGGLHEMPENLRYYFDYEAYARDARLGGDVTFTRGSEGLHVFWNH